MPRGRSGGTPGPTVRVRMRARVRALAARRPPNRTSRAWARATRTGCGRRSPWRPRPAPTVSPRPWVGAVVVPADQPTTGSRVRPTAATVPTPRSWPCAAGGRRPGVPRSTSRSSRARTTAAPRPAPTPSIDAGVAPGRGRASAIPTPTSPAGHRAAAATPASRSRSDCAPTRSTTQLAPYLNHRRTGRPYVVLKLAATLDGRTAAPDGSSQWITGAEARARRPPAAGRQRRRARRRGHGPGRRSRR